MEGAVKTFRVREAQWQESGISLGNETPRNAEKRRPLSVAVTQAGSAARRATRFNDVSSLQHVSHVPAVVADDTDIVERIAVEHE